MEPVVGVLALQGDVREHLAALATCDVIGRPVRRPTELDGVDALVIPGGESTTMSKLLVDFDLFEPIASRIKAGMPAYGSCAGMIMLATNVLDGRPDQRSFAGIEMTVRRNAFGRQVDSFEADVEMAGLGKPFHAVFIRAPWVEKIGAEVAVLGTVAHAAAPVRGPSEAGPVDRAATGSVNRTPIDPDRAADGPAGDAAAGPAGHRGPAADSGAAASAGRIVAVRQGSLLATSFHPELTGDLRVHRYFVEMVRDVVGRRPGR